MRINVVAVSALFTLVSHAQKPLLFLLPFPVMCCIHSSLVQRDEVKSLLEVVDSTCKARE